MNKTVLLVEDNEDNRAIYRTILEYGGYEVIEALDGAAGLREARERLPGVILMDIGIPGIDGWEATKILKADPRTRGIPVIALTAHALATDREKADDIGCDAYLAKPVEPQVVLEEVRRWMGGGTGRQEEEPASGNG